MLDSEGSAGPLVEELGSAAQLVEELEWAGQLEGEPESAAPLLAGIAVAHVSLTSPCQHGWDGIE